MAEFVKVPARRSVADAVHEQLRTAILRSELAPGDRLPGERTLTEQFGVNRHAVREAVKRLAEVGLVEVSHGGATRVRDWRHSAGLDVLPDIAFTDPAALSHALRMRRTVGVDAARLAAAARAAIAPTPADADGYEAFWDALVDASGNVAYRLALNSLVAGIHQIRDAFTELSRAEFEDAAAQDALRAAIADGDEDRAAQVAHALLSRTLHAVA